MGRLRCLAEVMAIQTGMFTAHRHIGAAVPRRLQPTASLIARRRVAIAAGLHGRMGRTEVAGFNQFARPLSGQTQQDQSQRCNRC